MAIQKGKDYAINLENTSPQAFRALANNFNVGYLFLGTDNYFFAVEVLDSTLDISFKYTAGESYVVSKTTYFEQKLKGKSAPEVISELLNDEETTMEDVEAFFVGILPKRGEQKKEGGLSGEYIDIQACELFKVKKMWIGGGTITYKDAGGRRQIPITQGNDAKLLKEFYEGKMKG